jgi:hypothetical protein
LSCLDEKSRKEKAGGKLELRQIWEIERRVEIDEDSVEV